MMKAIPILLIASETRTHIWKNTNKSQMQNKILRNTKGCQVRENAEDTIICGDDN